MPQLRRWLLLLTFLLLKISRFGQATMENFERIRISLIGFSEYFSNDVRSQLNFPDVTIAVNQHSFNDSEGEKVNLIAVYHSPIRKRFGGSMISLHQSDLDRLSRLKTKLLIFLDKDDRESDDSLAIFAADYPDLVELCKFDDSSALVQRLEREIPLLRQKGKQGLSPKKKRSRGSGLKNEAAQIMKSWISLSSGLESLYSQIAGRENSGETIVEKTKDFLETHPQLSRAINVHVRQLVTSLAPDFFLRSAKEQLSKVVKQLNNSKGTPSFSFRALSRSVVKSHEEETQQILSELDRITKTSSPMKRRIKTMTKMSRRWLVSQLSQIWHQREVESQLERSPVFRSKLSIPVKVNLNYLIQGENWRINQELQSQYDEHKEGQVVNRAEPLLLPFTARSAFTSASSS